MTHAPLAHIPGQARLAARYRQEQPAPAAWNETLDTLLSHRSVRAFRPDPLADGVLELIVAAAQSASTSSNLQPWSVIAVSDPERKARLAAFAGNQQHIVEAPLFLVWLIDLHRLEGIGQAEGQPAQALTYLESFLLGAVDTSLAAQNAVVALESLGLGAVYIGGIRNRPEDVAQELGLPPQSFALFGLAIGHPDAGRPSSVKPRLPQEAVLFRETYGGTGQAVAAYNRHLRAFQREQGLPEGDWSAIVAHRLRGAEALQGRDTLRDALHRLGFALA
ncbi:NADPH-dependent oxidoreductase [Novosphingobium terrae]|uniref:NADPH-dependent oxidoreductase n=1 Tax=Novosphingobium terrae TaxID=2726189 RepID=UPI0019810E01|nr:NADPH-dependent oxidoreductase [Novosphingobium terrae]